MGCADIEGMSEKLGRTERSGLLIGKVALVGRSHNGCCGKPQGCTNMNPGCAYLQHPYKRWARGEISLADLTEKTVSVCGKS